MSEPANRAVFLSYASQDAEAARRICEALRAAGVEVWFDQSELRGGDTWDAKIRKQIKECALFVPIISANTQRRPEGYFRLEWRLADQRTHLMGKSRAFLVPVCIDETRDSEADVPDSFVAVQWIRLPPGQPTAAFGERVRALLEGEREARPPSPAIREVRTGSAALPASVRHRWFAAAFIGMAVVAALIAWKPWQRGPNDPRASAPAAATPGKTTEARQLAERARRHFQGIFTRADLALAEDYGRRAAEAESTLALAWAVRAGANACYLMRGFVAGEAAQQRARDAQAFANQALALNRDETEALIALGQVAMFQNAPSQAEAYYRRVLAKDPNNSFAHRYLSIVLRSTGRIREAIALMQDAARRFPQDTLTHFDLALAYAFGWDWPRAWDAADAALALESFPGAQMLKVRLAFQWKGNVALMRELIEKLDVTYRGEDDAVVWDMRCGLWARQPERVLEAAGRTARQYLEESFIFPGPKAWFTARAHELAGRSGLARQQWQVAESLLRERLNADPQNLDFRLKLAVTLAAMGETEKAHRELQTIETAWRDQMSPDRAWDLATFYAAARNAPKTVALLREALHAGPGIAPLTVHHLRLDPAWDGIRDAAEFQALLANPPPLPAPVTALGSAEPAPRHVAGAKSVAVLAFKNLSDDKGSEYFSDGLSEELSNKLGRVPGLRVAGSTSAFSFKGKPVTVTEIARQLGVAHVVEGTVRREGNNVRITAKLINAADGFPIWTSDDLDRVVTSSIAAQEELAGHIAKSLSLKLGVVPAGAQTTVKAEALELYWQARQAWNLRTSAGLAQAEALLNRALALEPKFARAHAALADVWMARGLDFETIGRFNQRNSPELVRIKEKIRHALELEPDSPEAHASLGHAEWLAWNLPAAERELRQAVALNPSYPSAHQWLGRVLDADGRMDEARVALKTAAELDPLSPRILDNYASVLLDSGAPREALAVIERALAIQPAAHQARRRKSEVLLGLNRRNEALAIARALREEKANPNHWLDIYARTGLKAELQAALSELDSANVPPQVYLVLDRKDEAIAAFRSRLSATGLGGFLWPAQYDSIRNDPRIVQAIEEMGLTAAHTRAQAWRAAHPREKPAQKK